MTLYYAHAPICIAAVLFFFAASTADDVRAHTLNPDFVERVTGSEIAESHNHTDAPSTTSITSRRAQSRTYSTFPEWYIVYSAQEYAGFVGRQNAPSAFPYRAAVSQYWEARDKSVEALGGESAMDDETASVLTTIGYSFTVEHLLIGAYEQTVGRFTEFLGGHATAEDAYIEAVAARYANFLEHTPWYAFPYGEALLGLWQTWDLGSISMRGFERRAAYSVGYTAKAVYAGLIRAITRFTYEQPDDVTRFMVTGIGAQRLASLPGIQAVESLDGTRLRATAPRYRAFRDAARAVVRAGGRFRRIEHNERIMLTVVADPARPCLAQRDDVIFALPILTRPPLQRLAISTRVDQLHEHMRELESCGITIEHLYDY